MKMMRQMIKRVLLYFHEVPEERNPLYQNRANRKQIKIKKPLRIHLKEVKIRIPNHKLLDKSPHKDFQDQLMFEHQRQSNQNSQSPYFHKERKSPIRNN